MHCDASRCIHRILADMHQCSHLGAVLRVHSASVHAGAIAKKAAAPLQCELWFSLNFSMVSCCRMPLVD